MAANVDLAGILDLQVALLNFSLGFAPEKLESVDQILQVRALTKIIAALQVRFAKRFLSCK